MWEWQREKRLLTGFSLTLELESEPNLMQCFTGVQGVHGLNSWFEFDDLLVFNRENESGWRESKRSLQIAVKDYCFMPVQTSFLVGWEWELVERERERESPWKCDSLISPSFFGFVCFSTEKLQHLWEHKGDVPSVWQAFLPQHRVSQLVAPLPYLGMRPPRPHSDCLGFYGFGPLSHRGAQVQTLAWSTDAADPNGIKKWLSVPRCNEIHIFRRKTEKEGRCGRAGDHVADVFCTPSLWPRVSCVTVCQLCGSVTEAH